MCLHNRYETRLVDPFSKLSIVLLRSRPAFIILQQAPAPLTVRDATCPTCVARTAPFGSGRGAPGIGGSAVVLGAAAEIRGAWTSLDEAIATQHLLRRDGCVGSRGRVPDMLGPGPSPGAERRAPTKVRRRLLPCSGTTRLEQRPSLEAAFDLMCSA
ncbi:hypothetical protein NDU88_007275 [Pleurodeles waltl]|uniref:Uncharacterized protein n=1 Tax=Pleurodeles waltl TaxID=8319 RepID=A0AAV7NWX5_PLEWA|nr:hypothetical protein NDU88_007275 [Pleurodeles waltl]